MLQGANGAYVFDPEDRGCCIGEGGMGRVFKGEEKESKRKVAIKVLFRELTNNKNNIERFKIESTVKIRHKNLVEIIDFIENEGKFHIVSEFLEGEILSHKIDRLNKNGQTVTADEARKIILSICDGLEILHKSGIIHRDIKPSNIMLVTDENIKLFDYGVIKKGEGVVSRLTRDGSFIGSYQYASPEQIRNTDKAAINESTDVYSLGITLYELITGKVPFDGSSEYEIMDKHTKEIIPAHTKLGKGYYNLIANATAKDQKYRYKSISQFRDDLLKLPNGNVALIKHKGQAKGFKIAAAILAILLAGGAAWYFMYEKQNRENFAANVTRAQSFYSIAQYDSARTYYDLALNYEKADSIKHWSETLNTLIPGMQDFYNARYKDAFDKLQKAADMGSGDADYYLGELTYNGLGTIKDYAKGWEYTNKAAERGFKMAYWRIAYAYEHGKGVPKDKDKSDKYYLEAIDAMKKLAEGGDPEALGNLGGMYSAGSGVTQNQKIAFDYYLKSANTGYAFIMSNLANMYQYGYGVGKDMNEAVKWYMKSADLGHPASQVSLGILYLNGDGVEKNVTKGLDLLNKAAEQNYSYALNYLGYLYDRGDVVYRDYKKANEYYRKAIEFDNDNYSAMENLARDYVLGLSVDKNYAVAKGYYLKAIKTDSTRSYDYVIIGELYFTGGYGLPQSDEEFVRYCELAQRSGSLTEEGLGKKYNDIGVKAYNEGNYTRARYFFNLGARKNNVTAQRNIEYLDREGK